MITERQREIEIEIEAQPNRLKMTINRFLSLSSMSCLWRKRWEGKGGPVSAANGGEGEIMATDFPGDSNAFQLLIFSRETIMAFRFCRGKRIDSNRWVVDDAMPTDFKLSLPLLFFFITSIVFYFKGDLGVVMAVTNGWSVLASKWVFNCSEV